MNRRSPKDSTPSTARETLAAVGGPKHAASVTAQEDSPAVDIPGGGSTGLQDNVTVPSGIDPNRPNVARVYDYFLGGRDNFEADRAVADEILEQTPEVRDTTRANRELLGRVVRYLVKQGIRQFIDLGSGLPTQENVHQVAQAAVADARVVYIDYDPVVLCHGRALLATNPNTVVVRADLREPGTILEHPEVRALIDFTKPTAVLAFAVLHFLEDEQAYAVGNTLMDACPAGSYLAVSHVLDTDAAQKGRDIYARRNANANLVPRSREQIRRFFDGLVLVDPDLEPSPDKEPDLVYLSQWKQLEDGIALQDRLTLCGVARRSES
ncbi:SAM-dependent methyltransferase [Nonomuraea sp. SYSU D8015]|uniref:SAM-dependent methyltransferase n=1 Tax=Nonomuraea sp. SYSU D8015 TaxID=2593644 RepID=UPI001660120A|nr:SAM-dependent methyltransferase [Nonomuraea sp. SYSU D8015]